MQTTKYYIYALKDPATDEVRYVGRTLEPSVRSNAHINRTGDTAKHRWVAELKRKGLEPRFVILEVCTAENWHTKEAEYMQKFAGPNLLNERSGMLRKTEDVTRNEWKMELLRSKFYHTTGGSAKAVAELQDGRAFRVYGGPHTSSGYYYIYPDSTKPFWIPKASSIYAVSPQSLPNFEGELSDGIRSSAFEINTSLYGADDPFGSLPVSEREPAKRALRKAPESRPKKRGQP